MDLGFLRNRGFRVYKANSLPTLSAHHQELISSLVSRYLYTKYINSHNDLIPRYKGPEDIDVDVNYEKNEIQGLECAHLSIQHGPSTQTVVFLGKNAKFCALVKSASPLFLAEILESLDLDTSLALSPILLSPDFITECVNGLEELVAGDAGIMGNIDMAFSPRKPLVNNSLKTITVNFTKQDSTSILQEKRSPLDLLYAWLEKTTTLRFQHLLLTSVSCDLMAIRSNVISITCSEEPESHMVTLLTIILGSVHSR